jgi:hypothetical protein
MPSALIIRRTPENVPSRSDGKVSDPGDLAGLSEQFWSLKEIANLLIPQQVKKPVAPIDCFEPSM